MYKILTTVLFVFLIMCSNFLYAQQINFKKNYILKFPECKEKAENFHSRIVSLPVELSKINDKSFILIPPSGVDYDRWMKSVEEPEVKAWPGKIQQDDIVKISGAMGKGEGMLHMELTGKYTPSGAFQGNGKITPGLGTKKMPYSYKIEWALVPQDFTGKIEISNQLIYDGPPAPEPYWPEMITREEEAKRPVTDDLGIKLLAKYKPTIRQRFYERKKGSHKAFYDRLLSELTWEEIKYTPGILLLIDHLATLEKEDQERIAAAYVRDGSVDFFGDTPYEKLQKVPPLFLMLRCLDKMKPEDVQGLTEESPRFQTMRKAYESLSPAKLADTSLRQFVITISERLPEAFRKEYYQQSPKLRDYVKESGSSALRDLYLS